MNTDVGRQFRMERSEKVATLAAQHRPTLPLRKNINILTHRVDDRRTDEDRMERRFQPFHVEVDFEGRHLTADRVPANDRIEMTKTSLLGNPVDDFTSGHDHACTGAESGERTPRYPIRKNLLQSRGEHQPADRGRLTTRQYQCLDVIQFGRCTNFDRVDTQRLQRFAMPPEPTLQGEDSYGYQPRFAILTSISDKSSPRIGSPRPRLTLAMMAG